MFSSELAHKSSVWSGMVLNVFPRTCTQIRAYITNDIWMIRNGSQTLIRIVNNNKKMFSPKNTHKSSISSSISGMVFPKTCTQIRSIIYIRNGSDIDTYCCEISQDIGACIPAQISNKRESTWEAILPWQRCIYTSRSNPHILWKYVNSLKFLWIVLMRSFYCWKWFHFLELQNA